MQEEENKIQKQTEFIWMEANKNSYTPNKLPK